MRTGTTQHPWKLCGTCWRAISLQKSGCREQCGLKVCLQCRKTINPSIEILLCLFLNSFSPFVHSFSRKGFPNKVVQQDGIEGNIYRSDSFRSSPLPPQSLPDLFWIRLHLLKAGTAGIQLHFRSCRSWPTGLEVMQEDIFSTSDPEGVTAAIMYRSRHCNHLNRRNVCLIHLVEV